MALDVRAEVTAPPEILTIAIEGQLTVAGFRDQLDHAVERMRRGGELALLFDILRMSAYEPEVRDEYLRWHKRHGAGIRRVAVVTDRAMWRLVIATLGMASGGSTRAFDQVDPARAWLRTGR